MNAFHRTIRRIEKVLGLAGCAVVLSLSALGGARADSNDRFRGLVEPLKAEAPFTIGVTLVHLQDDFWKGIAYGIEDEAKRSGVTLVQVSVAGAYGNVREQFAQLEALKARGSQYIVVGAASFDGYDPVFKKLQESGSKVLAVGIPVNSPNVAFGVAQDDSEIGTALSKVVCQQKPNSTVMTIPGPAGAEWARLRYVAFEKEAHNCAAGMKVLPGSFGGSMDLAYGMSQASDLMLRNPKADVIYTPVISLGMGAAQAVRQQQRGKDVSVVSSAVVRKAIPMIEDGRLLAVASEPGILMGRLIVQYAIRDHEGKPMPNMQKDASLPYPYVNTPPAVINAKNAAAYDFDAYDLPPKDWNIKALQ